MDLDSTYCIVWDKHFKTSRTIGRSFFRHHTRKRMRTKATESESRSESESESIMENRQTDLMVKRFWLFVAVSFVVWIVWNILFSLTRHEQRRNEQRERRRHKSKSLCFVYQRRKLQQILLHASMLNRDCVGVDAAAPPLDSTIMCGCLNCIWIKWFLVDFRTSLRLWEAIRWIFWCVMWQRKWFHMHTWVNNNVRRVLLHCRRFQCSRRSRLPHRSAHDNILLMGKYVLTAEYLNYSQQIFQRWKAWRCGVEWEQR